MQLFNTGDVKWRQKAARLQKKKITIMFCKYMTNKEWQKKT